MTWTKVARKDFEDAVRSKMLWGLIAVFVAFMGFVVAIAVGTADTSEATASTALRLTAQLGQLFVPIIALVAGYMAIVGERRSGSLRILLSYPHSRRDVVLGKLAGRTAVTGVTLGIGSVLSILLVSVVVGIPDLGNVVGLLATVVLFGAAITGIAVGISAASRTRGRAMAVSIGLLLVFLIVWDAAVGGIYAVVTGSMPGLKVEPWYFLARRLSPLGAFRGLAASFVDGHIYRMIQLGVEDIPQGATAEQRLPSNRVVGDVPFYLSNWVAVLTLAVWGVLPAAVGYLGFRRSDL